jgi:SAM-dependent methyltransferase
MFAGTPCVDRHADAAAALERMNALGLLSISVCDPDGSLVGILWPEADRRIDRPIEAGALALEVAPLDAGESFENAIASITRQRVGWLPVVEQGKPVGMVGLGELLAHQEIDSELGELVHRVSEEVSPEDRMFPMDRTWTSYLSIGVSALACIRRSMELVGKREVSSVLDLACGHGRVLRVLKVAFPNAELTACDLNEDGVEFCARMFGATPALSHVDPEEVDLTGPFDLVWSGSLFTHLDAHRWDGFLELIESVTEPGALVMFTVHGAQIARGFREGHDPELSESAVEEMLQRYEETGFGYAGYPSQDSWGDSVVKREWVESLLERRPALRLVEYRPCGWARWQDVVTCVRSEA